MATQAQPRPDPRPDDRVHPVYSGAELSPTRIPDLTERALGFRREVRELEVVWTADRAKHEIALTFDDGPDPDGTGAMLEVLEHHQVRATFFVLAERAIEHPDLLRRTVTSGHSIGLHSDRHEPLDDLPASTLVERLQAARSIIEEIARVQVTEFRPPYGRISATLAQAVVQLRLRLVMWSHDPRDWEPMQQGELLERLDSSLHAGALLLLHDGSDGFPQQGKTSAAALDKALPLVRERRLVPITTGQL